MHTMKPLNKAIRMALTGGLLFAGLSAPVFADAFQPGNIIFSETDYTGTASTVTVGQTLPGGGDVTPSSVALSFRVRG